MHCPDGGLVIDRNLVGVLRRQRLNGLDDIGNQRRNCER